MSSTGGMTLHGAFGFNFSPSHEALSDKKLAEARKDFEHLKLILIDEMSMVDADKLYKILRRLSEVFQTDDLFANIAVILFGDLFQVNDS